MREVYPHGFNTNILRLSGKYVLHTVCKWAERCLQARIAYSNVPRFVMIVNVHTSNVSRHSDRQTIECNVLSLCLQVDDPTGAWRVEFRASSDPPGHVPNPGTNKGTNYQVSEVARLHEIGKFSNPSFYQGAFFYFMGQTCHTYSERNILSPPPPSLPIPMVFRVRHAIS